MTEEFKEFEQHALDDAIANGVNASEVQARCQDMARKISYFCLAMGKHTLIFGHRCPVRALLWPASPRTRSVHYCRLQCIWINGRRTWHGSHRSLRSLSVLPIWCLVVNEWDPTTTVSEVFKVIPERFARLKQRAKSGSKMFLGWRAYWSCGLSFET